MLRAKSRSIRDLEMGERGEYIHMDPYEEVKHQPGPPISHLQFRWLQVSTWKVIVYYICCILTAGILPVLALNYPGLQRRLTSSVCDPIASDFVEIKDTEDEGIEIFYGNVEHSVCGGVHYACFESLGRRYFALSSKNFEVSLAPDAPMNFSDRFVIGDPSSPRPDRNQIIALFGLNTMQLQAADPFEVVISEVMSPFYLFQYFAIAVWLYTDYIAYSVIVMFITIVSITFVCRDKLFNLQRLHDLAGNETFVTKINPNGSFETIGTTQLAPGDCYEVVSHMDFPCDSILIKGRVVVDESMLTGESVPVTKTEFVKSPTDLDATKRSANILYSGTKVKVVPPSSGNGNDSNKVIAMAYKTGFRSARGQCVAALITPKNEIVSFLPDAMRAIFFMVIITTAIFGWSADQLVKLDSSNEDIIIAYLTALTIAVPPGLVACLSIATSISVVRLAANDVSITDTTKLNAAGYCSFACFDKTGTLTDENIVYQGMKVYGSPASSASGEVSLEHIVRETMASCHSLSIVDGIPDGDPLEVELLRASEWKLSLPSSSSAGNGNGNAVATPPQGKPHEICRHFEFSPEKLRAGTVLHRPSGEYVFLVKGSPEMIINLAHPATLPANLEPDIQLLTKKGFRVLALAYRSFDESQGEYLMKRANQDELEKELVFLGLVYFTNKLKDDTYPRTIQALKDAAIMVTMITGDHYQTAIAISTECNILSQETNRVLYVIHDPDPMNATPHLPIIVNGETDEEINISFEQLIQRYYDTNPPLSASAAASAKGGASSPITVSGGVSGEGPLQIVMTGVGLIALKNHSPHLIEPLARITNTFARMKPGDKKTIVRILQEPNSHLSVTAGGGGGRGAGEENHVVFCGDGANDMEALSAATVGISLCDTATTVAAAVVSTKQTPLAVVEVLKEGRCSLVTAYVLVCFNISYAIIQLFMTCYLNNMGLVFGDNMYIVQDLFFSLILGLCISDLSPADNLSIKLPPKTLFCPGLMIKLLLQLGIFPAIQAITLEILKTQDGWYTEYETDDPLNDSWAVEGATLNIIALSQLMIAAVVVTIGAPYRKPWYTSKTLLTVLALQAAYILYLLFGETNPFMKGVSNKHVPPRFAGILLAIIAANIAISAAATKFADLFF
jgi:cation-transporting P-type ATPase 13A2